MPIDDTDDKTIVANNIACPECGARTKVTTTRGDGRRIVRGRKCLGCGENYQSREMLIGSTPEAPKYTSVINLQNSPGTSTFYTSRATPGGENQTQEKPKP